MSPIRQRRSSGAHAVYDVLRARIIDGTLAPEARLTEPDLAQSLDVSRTPVREALRLLMAEGLVQQRLTGGMRVAALHTDDLDRIYEIRGRLEGLMARDACVRMDARGRDKLQNLMDLMERMKGVDTAILDLGRQFHGAIAEIADNPWCANLLHQIGGQVDRYRARSTRQPGRPDEAVAEHRRIFDQVTGGDPDAAEQAMRDHVALSAAAARRALQHDVVPDASDETRPEPRPTASAALPTARTDSPDH